MLSLGIVGLPNAGKSTLFNAITRAGAEVRNYPFTTIEPNVGVVEVPDDRLFKISEIVRPEKITMTAVRFVDIAGLVKGASRGEGLGNRFLAHIHEVDGIIHVVRCFSDDNVSHVEASLDPLRDIDVVNTELILADLETVLKRREKTAKMLKTGERKYREEMDFLDRVKEGLERGVPVRLQDICDGDQERVKDLFLLTAKPVVYAVNIGEEDITGDSPCLERVRAIGVREKAEVVPVCAKIEAEIAEFDHAEAKEFAKELGLKDLGLERLVKAGHSALGLITFFTIKGSETRAWAIREGTSAQEAAGKVHSDMERGFIKAEVVWYGDLIKAGSMARAKDEGLVRIEGRDYVVRDGDVVLFKFNI